MKRGGCGLTGPVGTTSGSAGWKKMSRGRSSGHFQVGRLARIVRVPWGRGGVSEGCCRLLEGRVACQLVG